MLIRINLNNDGNYKEFYGTPVEIVDQMRAMDMFGSYADRREYVRRCAERLRETSDKRLDVGPLETEDDEKLAVQFLAAIIQDRDLGALVVNEQTFDGGTIKTLRAATRLSQVRYAQLVGVDPQTVSRWEREQSRPSSTAVISSVREKSRKRAVGLEAV